MNQSDSKNYMINEKKYFNNIEEYFNESSGEYIEKMHAFCRFVPRQSLSYFLARSEIYKLILNLHGSILDFGIYRGGSYFTWLQLSSILEPYNHLRKIIGFDSFNGYSKVNKEDSPNKKFRLKYEGGMKFKDGLSEINAGKELFELNRPLGHVKMNEIIDGELPLSLERYMDDHQETIIVLANIGLGLYESTKQVLSLIKPRLIKGSILVFEDLNQSTWPGETKALFEVFSHESISLKRFEYALHLSYMIYNGE